MNGLAGYASHKCGKRLPQWPAQTAPKSLHPKGRSNSGLGDLSVIMLFSVGSSSWSAAG